MRRRREGWFWGRRNGGGDLSWLDWSESMVLIFRVRVATEIGRWLLFGGGVIVCASCPSCVF